jgi:rSAM/selenodomain-associated transferase 2
MLSVVIPTLNAAATLPATLAALAAGRAAGLVGEVLAVDGGSIDATCALAGTAGARVIASPRGRGAQLRLGGEAAAGKWLLFLHADTALAPGWADEVRRFIAGPAAEAQAAAFRFALDDAGPGARRLERLVAWRCRWLALPYGDQGLLLSRALYDAVGGFRALPLMEDVDLVRRLGRRRLCFLETPAVTSAARYRRSGYLGRSLRNAACLVLYLLGVPPAAVARLYG